METMIKIWRSWFYIVAIWCKKLNRGIKYLLKIRNLQYCTSMMVQICIINDTSQVLFFLSMFQWHSFPILGWNHWRPCSSRFRRQRHEPTPENQGHQTARPSQHSQELTPFVRKPQKKILSSVIVFHVYAWLSLKMYIYSP